VQRRADNPEVCWWGVCGNAVYVWWGLGRVAGARGAWVASGLAEV
jgi:hypothetical protein